MEVEAITASVQECKALIALIYTFQPILP